MSEDIKESSWITKLMSGADNKSPAIGRWLGTLLFLNTLTLIPFVVLGSLVLQNVKWDTWSAVFMTLTAYVPSVVASITLLIRVTDQTEPKP